MKSRFTLRLSTLCLLLATMMGGQPDAMARQRRDEPVVVSDSRGAQRAATLRWNLRTSEDADGQRTVEGQVALRFRDTSELHTWRIVAVELQTSKTPGSARRDLLRLRLVPAAAQDGVQPVEALVHYEREGSGEGDTAGRLEVKFSWTLAGVGRFEAKGEITMKGSKILIN